MDRAFRAGALLLAAAVAALLPRAEAARTPQPAAVVVTPTGATLRPGDRIEFRAEALDSNGQPFPGAVFAWASTRAGVLRLEPSGATAAAVALQPGAAVVRVKSGRRTAELPVTVLAPGESPSAVAAGLGQVNHLAADDDWLYWIEADRARIRLRKTPRAGGPIYDLVSEPARDGRGLRVTYAHLRRIDDTLYFSRQTLGFFDHWSLRAVPTAGGPVVEVLPEDVSAEPLFSSGWQVSGRYLVVALLRPERIGLPTSVDVATYDTASGVWAPLVAGQFVAGRCFVTAAAEGAVYIRGLDGDGRQRILRAVPGGEVNSFRELYSAPGTDGALDEPGAADARFLYFWSQRSDGDAKLVALPVEGGELRVLQNGGFGPGLTTDGIHLYWVRGRGTLVRLPTPAGGPPAETPVVLQERVFPLAAAGGFPLDEDGLFFVRQDSRKLYSLRELAPR